MTDGLRALIEKEANFHLAYEYLTAPSGPGSINNEDDGDESTKHCIPVLTKEVLEAHDAFVVACYSNHSLVGWLQEQPIIKAGKKQVFGIFGASVLKSLRIVEENEKYGIVSTGKYWEEALTDGVKKMADKEAYNRFAGVKTTGLNAKELHDLPEEVVQAIMIEATRKLVKSGDVTAVCLGCAGMAGMDETVRKACVLELGAEKGEQVKIVDGVLAAVELIAEARDP